MPPMAALPFSFPGVKGVRCLFSAAGAGDMSLAGDGAARKRAAANRRRFMRSAGFSFWAEAHQVHGDALLEARGGASATPEGLDQADGLYTLAPGVGLIIKTADCQPILIAREDGAAVAALHVGWRGNAIGFPGSAVRRLCAAFSCGPEELLAVRGPSLGPAAAEFVNFHAEWPGAFAPWFDAATKTVNLWALTRHQLETAGLRPDRVFSLDLCTRDMAETFFSYRRGDAARQVSAIWLEA